MAGVAEFPPRIGAGQQFRAVAWLRWRLFANGFRRKGGKGELAARIMVYLVAGVILLGITTGSGAIGWAIATKGALSALAALYTAIFALQVLTSINIAPPGLSFDPESLIRYPVTFPRYLAIRIVLGLLAASNIVGTVALLAAATGVTIARPDLWGAAFAVALALAVTNMLAIRMAFAWVDRWLSTRRARELFTFAVIAFSIGIQYLNVTFNNLGRHSTRAQQAAKIDAAVRFYHASEAFLRGLPPGLGARAVQAAGAGAASAAVAGILLYGLVFLGVFAWRMQREYRGERLSEVNHGPAESVVANAAPVHAAVPVMQVAPQTQGAVSPVLLACVGKEWTYVRRNPAQFYGLLAPLAMVLIFAARMQRFSQTGMTFPGAAAYSILGVSALAYNVLGLDASGVQFYFLAPVSFRTIFLAKNLFGFGLTAAQLVLLYGLLCFTSGRPPALLAVETVCWVVFAALVNATMGNMRSITAPKKVDPSRISRRQASQLSGLLAIGIMLVVAGVGAGLLFVARLVGVVWLPLPILAGLAFGAFALYWAGLNRVDAMALGHREGLIEELSKTE